MTTYFFTQPCSGNNITNVLKYNVQGVPKSDSTCFVKNSLNLDQIW